MKGWEERRSALKTNFSSSHFCLGTRWSALNLLLPIPLLPSLVAGQPLVIIDSGTRELAELIASSPCDGVQASTLQLAKGWE